MLAYGLKFRCNGMPMYSHKLQGLEAVQALWYQRRWRFVTAKSLVKWDQQALSAHPPKYVSTGATPPLPEVRLWECVTDSGCCLLLECTRYASAHLYYILYIYNPNLCRTTNSSANLLVCRDFHKHLSNFAVVGDAWRLSASSLSESWILNLSSILYPYLAGEARFEPHIKPQTALHSDGMTFMPLV